MDFFPRKDVPAHLADAYLTLCATEEPPAARPWITEYFRPAPAALPERPMTQEERILGFATVWSTAKYNFAYWDQLPGEEWWDAQFATYLPQVIAATDDADYWQLMQRFGCLLADGHTGVYLPAYLRQGQAQPPVRIAAIEGQAVVMDEGELPRGSIILTVDGAPAAAVRARMQETLQSSTTQSSAQLSAEYILRGPADSEVDVVVQLPDGDTRTCTLRRAEGLPARLPFVAHDLGGGIWHVELNTYATMETADQFHAHFASFNGVRALILDVRENGGGSGTVGHSILARLLSEPCHVSAVRLPLYCPTFRAWGLSQRWLSRPVGSIQPDTSRPRFDGPVAALSGPSTGSAAEDFLVAFQDSRRGLIIGGPSCGSTGQPLYVQLPGGGAFRVCTKRDTHPDGTPFVGRGIQPDLPCAPTLAGVIAGRDEVLERAVQHLRTLL